VPHRLAAVFAHPDDDTFGLGGTLLLHPDAEYTLIVATSGAAGMISDPSLATPETLADVREQEERNALATLGREDVEVHFLRYPDMGLSEVPRAELVGKVAQLLAEVNPDVVVTFGPEGITGHADHVTIGQAATEAFHEVRAKADGRGFERLYYNAIPQSDLDLFRQVASQAGLDMGDPDDPFRPKGVPDDTIAVRVDCSSVADLKIEALRAHETQADEIQGFPDELLRAFASLEYFVQAWPEVTERRALPAADMFQGMAQTE